jgi:hypothetical protein
MEIVTKYKAFDGSEFTSEAACIQHEQNCNIAEKIMQGIPKEPDGCYFANGSGYIQHDKSKLLQTRNEFIEFCKRYSSHKWLQETIDKGWDAHSSWAGRILDECAPRSINKQWYRFSCIDSNFREWGQPYYANNPDQAKQVRLN